MKILDAKFSLLLLHISEAYLKYCQTSRMEIFGKYFFPKTPSQMLGRVLFIFADITFFGYNYNFLQKLVNGDGTVINFNDHFHTTKIVISPFSC